jgi:hypothetical protein
VLDSLKKTHLIRRSSEGEDPDVVGEIEGRGVDPQRPAEPAPGCVEKLTEARDLRQAASHHLSHCLGPEATV